MTDYQLEKWVWTEADFDQMGWHDARIYALAFPDDTFEFLLDIDYILQWIDPGPSETYYKFWLVPATLVFHNVHDLQIDLEPFAGLEIQDVTREDPQRPKNAEYVGRDTEWRWTIETHEGAISLNAVGYTQYLRKKPIYCQQSSLDLYVRGGISFERRREDI